MQRAPRGTNALSAEDHDRGRDPSGTIGRNVEPLLLLALLRGPSYGYDLIRQIAETGFRHSGRDPGVVYRVLRSLEESGAIRSQWSTPQSGPARRYYEITDQGRRLLARRAHQVKSYHSRVAQFLREYTALTGDDFSTGLPDEEADTGERETAPVSSRS